VFFDASMSKSSCDFFDISFAVCIVASVVLHRYQSLRKFDVNHDAKDRELLCPGKSTRFYEDIELRAKAENINGKETLVSQTKNTGLVLGTGTGTYNHLTCARTDSRAVDTAKAFIDVMLAKMIAPSVVAVRNLIHDCAGTASKCGEHLRLRLQSSHQVDPPTPSTFTSRGRHHRACGCSQRLTRHRPVMLLVIALSLVQRAQAEAPERRAMCQQGCQRRGIKDPSSCMARCDAPYRNRMATAHRSGEALASAPKEFLGVKRAPAPPAPPASAPTTARNRRAVRMVRLPTAASGGVVFAELSRRTKSTYDMGRFGSVAPKAQVAQHGESKR
jgi:hypothetical protein